MGNEDESTLEDEFEEYLIQDIAEESREIEKEDKESEEAG